MVYLIRTVLKSGMQARGGAAYTRLEQAILAAGEQLRKGFAVDAWIEDESGTRVVDAAEIKRRCEID